MNIPESTLEPFGYTGIPHLQNQWLADKIFGSLRTSFIYWTRELRSDSDFDMGRLIAIITRRARFGGGENVTVNAYRSTLINEGSFTLTVAFSLPNSTMRFERGYSYP